MPVCCLGYRLALTDPPVAVGNEQTHVPRGPRQQTQFSTEMEDDVITYHHKNRQNQDDIEEMLLHAVL